MEHDYDISTDDDSTHARAKAKKSTAKTKKPYALEKSKRDTILMQLSEWAGVTSALLFIGFSLIAIQLETSVGNKIASLTWKQ